MQKACHDVNCIVKEIVDLIEDEEEDVACAIIEDSMRIIEFFFEQFGGDRNMIEKYISPIISKIITLMAN